ncbi:hypothetical protein [Deinococcus peraridilitoris]|uniref:DinB-like domain-containing protein n=1 Tax=Deinococcus peraridilitoris (strain DSM 19664 / LMG 22246 / CIP 109416 / KR-200) TaxID=937777 RepID=L0A208_DEIPD|nr:hypothetical protein [Deinococcus peraridilitoris]AFZ67881.1 hypothetical protein Deipe_2406 [Deinococcus peraridilitoris DSM 19664]
MSDQAFVQGWLDVLQEACEGGQPGQGTGFLDGTRADGSGNHGLFATLDALSATQASDPTLLGLSVAAHAAHTAFHLEVGVRWAQGERGPFDWPGSFEPRTVDEAAWQDVRARVRAAYTGLVSLARRTNDWDEDAAGGLAAALAHVSYHLGAVRQIVKLLA